jgi:hypothetical protein
MIRNLTTTAKRGGWIVEEDGVVEGVATTVATYCNNSSYCNKSGYRNHSGYRNNSGLRSRNHGFQDPEPQPQLLILLTSLLRSVIFLLLLKIHLNRTLFFIWV